MILRCEIGRSAWRDRGLGGGGRRRRRGVRLIGIARRKEMADTRRLLFLRDALLLGIDTRGRSWCESTRSGDRPAEIAGKWRAQLGYRLGQPGIIPR